MIHLFHSPKAVAMLHTHLMASLSFPPRHRPFPSPFHSPLILISLRKSAIASIFQPWLAEFPDSSSPLSPIEKTEGPVELPSSSLFAIGDNPTPLQTATSVLLTGAITVLLFRSLRRRARRAKDLRVRSTGTMRAKDVKEEGLERLKAIGLGSVEARSPPSPVQALLGGITAGVIAVVLYKFTTVVEAGLNRQTISDNFSVRQLTITIRTIVNGLCYLATFVFGVNSIGLILYSIQLAFSSVMEGMTKNSSSIKSDVEKTDATDPFETSAADSDSRKKEMPESSDEP